MEVSDRGRDTAISGGVVALDAIAACCNESCHSACNSSRVRPILAPAVELSWWKAEAEGSLGSASLLVTSSR